ncbi:protein translocase subunit SecD [candidate division KSB1 bacterium]|nr:protein translocase subunit SecD [candidate division KSB1 bacterium]
MKSIRSRIIVLVVLLGLGGYYLYPTVKYENMSNQESVLLTKLSETSGIPLARLGTDIYRDDVDLKSEIESGNLDALTKEEAVKQLEYLRGDFYTDIKYYRPKAIKRGLDLQGGMYLVLEVDLVQMLDNSAKGKDEVYDRMLSALRTRARESDIDVLETLHALAVREKASLSRYWGEAGQTDDAIITDLTTQADDAVDRSLEILRNRIDQFGVSEPSISKLGTRRIALELPGVKDPVRARELVGRTAQLDFKILVDAERARDILTKLDQGILARQKGEAPVEPLAADSAAVKADTSKHAQTDTSKIRTDSVKLADSLAAAALDSAAQDTSAAAHPLLSLFVGGAQDILVEASNKSRVVRLLSAKEYQRLIPTDVAFYWSSKSQIQGTEGNEYWILYLVKKQAELTGATISDANSSIGSGYEPDQAGKPIVQMEFNREGSRIFSRVTGANVGKRLGIVLDDKVYMAPNIRDKISGGSAVITGLDDMAEARDIAIVLRAGALPAPVSIAEERTVGPSLGEESVGAGQLCLSISFLAVILFMVWYYRASGLIADLAMIFNVFLLMGALAMFQFTLTMPGIAGIILTIGMAVDANVLIFERIREELRAGKTVRVAIDTGFNRALLTIIDSNTTTAIAGVVLLIYGTGAIKGFALTLTVGIVINMFTAIFLTRLVYDAFTQGRQLKTLSV